MPTRERLKMAIYFLKNGLNYRLMQQTFGVSKSFISRDLKHTITILCSEIKEIKLPTNPQPFFLNVIGCIDCTIHIRRRTTVGESLLYRGDKKTHFLSLQLVCDLTGVPIMVNIGLGHNNDASMFNHSGIGNWLIQNDLSLFADQGYHHPKLITPITPTNEVENFIQFKQYAFRSHIETVFSQAKNFLVAYNRFKQNIFFQKMVLMVVYNLVALNIKKRPLRNLNWLAENLN